MATSAKRAGEEADRLIAELAGQKKAATEQPAAESQLPAEAGEAEQGQTQESVVAGNPSDVGVQANQQSDEEMSTLRKEIAVANARWQSLQGMVNKKDSEIEQMRLLLAQLSKTAEQQPAQSAQTNLVTTKDEEDFGADMVDLNRRVAAEVFNRLIKAVEARMDKMEQSIAGVSDTTTKISEGTFNEALTRQVPNWETTDKDPEFIAWLNEPDSFTGRTKLELLQHAYSTGNLKSTVAFFKAFENEKRPAAQQAEQTQQVSNVAKFVAPGKSKSSAAPVNQVSQPKIWTSSAISKLYDDKRNRRITEEEFVKQESDLFAAQRDGRIAA